MNAANIIADTDYVNEESDNLAYFVGNLEYAGFEIDHITKHSKNSKGWATRAGRRKGDTSTKLRFAKKIRL